MQFQTHIASGLALTLPFLHYTNELNAINVLAFSLGTVFPDIDEPNSFIGKRTRGISHLMNMLFGHRGMTHSLLAVGVAILIGVAIFLMLDNIPAQPILLFLLGYLTHIVQDSFSKSGVKWFLPFNNRSFQSGCHTIYYTTGGLAEYSILFISCLIIMIFIKGV